MTTLATNATPGSPAVVAAREAIEKADNAAFSALHTVHGDKARSAARDARSHANHANRKSITAEGHIDVIIECLGLAQDATVLALSYTSGINATLSLARSFAASQAAIEAVRACGSHNEACLLIDGHDGECIEA